MLLYRVVSRWDVSFGPWPVLGAGLGSRVLLLTAMVVLTGRHSDATVLPILVCFAGTQVVWPLLSVASMRLSVMLSPAHRAESVGLLNAATALGATMGGVFGGVLLRAGFVWLCAAVLGLLLISLLLVWHPKARLGPDVRPQHDRH